jgi:hypothetical protein
MDAVEQFPVDGAQSVTFAKDQPEYLPLPALVYPDGVVLTEWRLTEDERQRIARGENLRLWIWTAGRPLQPVALEVTDERKG